MRNILRITILSLLGFGVFIASPAQADDYSNSLEYSWGGTTYTHEILDSFLSTRVISPGANDERTLTVRNSGPTEGTLRVSLINLELVDVDGVDVHHNPDHVAPDIDYSGAGDQGNFYNDLLITWNDEQAPGAEPFTAVNGTDYQIGEYSLAPGETRTFTFGFNFPEEATSGNSANIEQRAASFDVEFVITGELPKEDDALGSGNWGQNLPKTGGPAFWFIIAGFASIGVGIALMTTFGRKSKV